MPERDYVRTADLPARTVFLPGTAIEIVRPPARFGAARHALFDFDGTLSLIREGWPGVMIPMMVEVLRTSTRTRETDEDLHLLATDFVMRLNGKQTIYQMIRLAEEVRARGGRPEDPLIYKKMYHDRLMDRIARRRDDLRAGAARPEDWLVPGAFEILTALRDQGVMISIASGTDEPYVLEEAALLGLDRFADGGVYGAPDDYENYSKEMVIQRILSDHRVQAGELLVFGDGYVEIQDGKAAGGIAVAVATDEAGRSGRADAWKRERLIGAGADIVIPDYRDQAALLDYLWDRGPRP
jgi:phosphoglycolate phosphatase